MKFSFVTAALLALSLSAAQAQDISGVWQTEAADTGGYLHVTMAPCGDKMCGTILQAYDQSNTAAADYEHIGKQMIWDMAADGAGSWKKGKIWAPDQDKTYNAKMEMTDAGLKVSGCVLVICRSQIWRKVQ